jgi:hypothetical protein
VNTDERLVSLLGEVKRLAGAYRDLTGRPLGVTGEMAEYEAVRLLGVELAAVRQAGFDATRQTLEGTERVQIKGRCILPSSKPGQRVGGIKLGKEWDVVLLVLLDENFEATAIYEAGRPEITAALLAPGSVARNERGALAVSKFKSIGRRVWPPAST